MNKQVLKKLSVFFLCGTIVLSVLCSCEKKATVAKGNGETITIGIRLSANVADYEDNEFTKWLEETSGYNIEIINLPINLNEAKSQIAAMAAAGEKMPDILWGVNLGEDLYKEYGDDGYFVDLSEYLNNRKKSAVFWDRFESEFDEKTQNNYLLRMTDQSTGAIYGMPEIQTSSVDNFYYQTYINQQWLDTLNLKAPTNNEELYKVLKAFKDKDPNGNGLADEMPLIGSESGYGSHPSNWLINNFVYCSDVKYFSVNDNGKLYLPQTTDEYREAMKYINKLVSEGLLSDMAWSMKSSELIAILNPADGKTALAGIFCGHPTSFLEIDNEIINQYVALAPWGCAAEKENAFTVSTFITTDCENPEAAFNLLLNMYTKEGSLRMRYGEYGKDWVNADKNSKSFIGRDAEIKVLNEGAFNDQTKSTWNNIASTILIDAENEATQVSDDLSDWVKRKYEIFSDYYEYFNAAKKNNPKNLCPYLVYNQKEKDAYDNIIADCGNYIKDTRASFAIGHMDPNKDSDWNSYLNQLKELGSEKWIKAAQTVYNRQMKE